MKGSNMMKTQLKPLAAAVSLALVSGHAAAIDYYLAAKPYTKTLPGGVQVPMWGYVEDAGGTCFDAASDAARLTCIAALPDPGLESPRLTVPPGQTALRVFLSNGLPEPTSIIVTGQELPIGNYPGIPATSGPTWNDGSTGPRANPAQRVRSFVPEAPADGGRMGYIWNNNQGTPIGEPGTFIYHSGTWPQKQVYMGLAGLVTKDAAAGEVYSAVPYDNEVTLFYSDIDPAFNSAVSNGSLSTAIERHPTWYLINGEPYESGMAEIDAGAVGESTLVRFASAATDTHVAVVQGMEMTIHAEDGLRYNFQNGSTFGGWAPRTQYSAMLPPLKTKDAILVAPEEGSYAVYDGNGYMTNPSSPGNEAVGDSVGGMLRFLAFGAGGGPGNAAPVVTPPTPDPLVVVAPLCEASVPATDAAIADWLAAATATDTEDGPLVPTTDAPADFPIGDTVVTFTATDSASATGTATATVQVQDTPNTAPTVTAPAVLEITVANGTASIPASDPQIQDWLALVAGTDAEDGTPSITNDAPGSFPASLAPGTATTVTFTATDACGLEATDTSTVTVIESDVVTPTTLLYFSTAGGGTNGQVPGVPSPWNNADLYSYDDAGAYDRVLSFTSTMGFNANVDALDYRGPSDFYVSFSNASVDLGGGLTVQDEDVAHYDGSSWSLYFDGSVCGLDASNGQDVDAISIDGGTLYFSTVGGGNGNSVGGATGPYDDADVYTWSGGTTGTANCGRALDASTVGLPGNADIDGLTVKGGTYYMSFVVNGGTAVPTLPGLVQDESVVSYDGSNWALYFSGAGDLDSANGQNLDAIQVP